MINNTNLKRFDRLSGKNLNMQFINRVVDGMNCAPFAASALLECVYEVFGPLFDSSQCPKPGQVQLSVVNQSVPPNIPLETAKQILVTLTLDAGDEDLQTRQEGGVAEVRRQRMVRMATEAFDQGGLLTLEDLAYRLFNCGLRTLVNDLAVLRKRKCFVPLRSTVKDIGRAVTHRRAIITRWLHGEEYHEIGIKTHHSITAVSRYIDTFKLCVSLFNHTFDRHTIAFLVHISPTLVQEFLTIYTDSTPVPHRQQELDEYVKKNSDHQGE